MKRIYCLTTLVLCHLWVLGQSEVDLSTPRKSLEIFVTNTQDATYDENAASVVFSGKHINIEQKVEYAQKLDQILRGSGTIIKLEEVPDEHNYFDSTLNAHIYPVMPNHDKIALERVSGLWRFQLGAMAEIDSVHAEMFRFGTELILGEKVRDTFMSEIVFGLQIWQWMGLGVFLVFGLIIKLIFTLLFKNLLIKYLLRTGRVEVGHTYIIPVVKPLSKFFVLLIIGAFYPLLELPVVIGHYLVMTLKVIVPLFGTVVLFRLVDIIEVIIRRLVNKTESTLDDQLVPLVKKILKVVVIVVGGLVILDSIDVPILPLLTGLSIGGLAFALAAQDTIKNFFGSMMIFVDKPFQIGDWISSGDIDGTVEEVGFRSTRVRTFTNSVVYVPNGMLADTVINNHGLRHYRRFKMMIAIKYDTPPKRIEIFIEGLRELVLRHPKTNKNNFEVHLNEMGSSSLDILFYIFFEAPTWSDELNFREELLLDILRLAQAVGVEFAYPTQTLHVENLPGQNSLSSVYDLTEADLRNKLKGFLAK